MKGLASNTFKYVALVLLTSLLVMGLASIAMSGEKPPTTSLIVRMAKGLSVAEQNAAIQRNGGIPKSSIPQLNMHVVEVPAPAVDAVMKKFKDDRAVTGVEINRTRKVGGIPNDAMLSNQWALPKIGWDQVYGNVTPNSAGYVARVAILDTGINAAHLDLAAMVAPGTSYVNSGSDGTTDPHGHGTWLAGIVAAQTNNLAGIAGVAYGGVQVMPVQVIAANGEGQDIDIMAGVVWAADHGADVILMSFSNPGFSQSLQDAIEYAWLQDVVLVAAVGNEALGEPTYPAGDAGVVGVSATDMNDALASFSNFGPAAFIAAPGVEIYSTGKVDPYVSLTGSSASSAIVAGVAAFMRAVDPTLTNGVIVGRLARNADPAGSADPAVARTLVGNGRVNMPRALADTSLEAVKPAGAPGGGPFVGPYRVAGNATKVSGYVKDNSDNPIAGATVSCTTTSGCNANFSATTNVSGYYEFSAAANGKLTFAGNGPATLTLTASKSGYDNIAQSLTVINGGTYTLDFTLGLSCTAPLAGLGVGD